MKKTHILFGQSYYLRFDPKLWEAMHPYPPLGTLFAASYIRELGYDVAVFDAMLADSEREWESALKDHQPDYAVIFEDNFNYLSKMCLTRMRDAAFTMIKMAKAQGCTVIVCGSDATDHFESYLAQGADYVLLGEGEETLGELLQALKTEKSSSLSQIPGLAFENHPHPTRRPVMRNIDRLPLPAWDLIDVDKYRTIWMDRHGYFSMNLATTRGCPYHCNWCAKPIWGQRYNVHSPAWIVSAMAHLKETYHPDHLWFADDIMGLKPGWFEQLADELEQAQLHIPFKCLSRVDLLLRGDTIPALKRAGCEIVWVGAESGSQKILDAMEKGTQVDDIREAAQKLRETGVKVGFFLQFGYPGETREDIELTLQLVRDCQPDDIGISVSYPLPGTSFHERVKSQLGQQQNWQDSSDLAMLYEGPFTTEFYRQLHTVVHKEFRSSKVLDHLRSNPIQVLRNPDLRQLASTIYHRTTLPLARMKLDQLANVKHQGIQPLAPILNHAQAATPTPQEHE